MAGFIKSNVTNGLNYVLTADGGHKALTDFAMSTALSGYLPFTVHSSMSTDIPADLPIGLHSIYRPGVEYSSVFVVKDYNNKYAQLYFHPTADYTNRIYYRKGSASWYTLAYTSDLSSYLPLSGGTMTGNIILGNNSIIYNKVTTSSWNLGSNTGLRILNTAGASATGAPSLYSVGLHVSGYYGFLLSCNGAKNVFTIRSMSNGIDTPKSWVTLIHSGNISSYGYITGITKQMVIDALGYTPPTTNSTYNFSGTTFYSGNSSNAEHNANNAIKNGNYYYNSNGPATTLGASTGDGALYVLSYSDSWVGQIALDYRNGRLFVRGKNNGTWQNWRVILDSNNISDYALTSLRTADALGAGGAPITTSVNNSAVTNSYYILATTSSGSCGWYQLPSTAFSDNNTTYSAGTGLTKDGNTFNALVATNTLLGVTKYVKYYSAASVKRYNGDVGGSEVDTSTTANIELAYASSTSGRFYPVLVDKNGFPFVNIPWSDTNTTYTFTTSGSGNVLTGVSTSGTTITFTKGNVSSGSTYGVVSNSENGLAPKVISTNTASIGSAYYVLASTNGSASPSWYKLPSTAFSDNNSWRTVLINGTSIGNNTLNIKSGGGISVGNSSGTATISLYISVNGSTAGDSTSIYAPTTAGTSGYILQSNGSGAPGWTSFTSISSIVKILSSVPSSFNSNTLYVITG